MLPPGGSLSLRRCAIQRMSPKTALPPHQQHHENILEALTVIDSCGWSRAAELGSFIWPQNALPKAPASVLIKTLLAANLVHAIDLPDRAGAALLLTRRGAAMLRQERQLAATACERWEPPGSWRHDLIAVGLLAQLHRRGWRVIPEASIRRQVNLHTTKIPDGLARDLDGRWWWIEMEHARKSGPAMKHLAQTAAAIGLGRVEILGIRPVGMLVGYPETARDEGGNRIDHQLRVTRAIERTCSTPVHLIWAACTLYGAGVQSCNLETSTAHPDLARRVLQTLEAQGWRQAPETPSMLVSQHPPHRAYVWKSAVYHPPWVYDADGPGIQPYTEAEVRPTVATLTEAKMAAAALIADAIAAEKAARTRKRL